MTKSAADSAPRGGHAAARVGGGIFVSRLLGFVRERVIAHYFGTSDAADAFRAAMRLPNVIRNLMGEGTLSASVVPIYSAMIEEGRDEDAARFAGVALGLLAVVAGAVVIIGWLLAPVIVAIVLNPWAPEKQALTTSLVRILFPMVGLLVIGAWAMSILDSHRRFFVSYVAPALWNVAQITAVVGAAIFLGLAEDQRSLVIALGWGALVGGGLQLALQFPFALRQLGSLRPSLDRSVEGVREAIANFVPIVTARGVVNLSSWIEMFLAGFLAGGALAVMGYAQTFYFLPISLFGISVAAAELPELSRMRDEDREALASRVSKALERVTFFLVPSTVGYLFVGDVIIAGMYQTGEFTEAQTLVVWAVLAAFALGLPATASSRALSSAFYALRDTKTPAVLATLRIAIALVTGAALMIPLDRVGVGGWQMGAVGLAIGASVGAWVEYGLLRLKLGARLGPHGFEHAALIKMLLAAAIAAAVAVGVQQIAVGLHPVWIAVATLTPFGVVYLGLARALGLGFSLRRAG